MLLTLQEIKKARCIVEVNTRGLYKKKTNSTYPSPWVLDRILEMEIPITLNSDAHQRDELTSTFPEVVKSLLQLGFKTIRVLSSGIWKSVSILE